eukprot:TRINITY_DN1784_c1_g1_i2.p1 TRINITY_DN1784_c1_g1~~TRINITY_DN1784_c1_g1_i2.p1  ORF type:complete len:525 (-),score=190.76 TRINITY_DN1784_c1_g1_i2:190-1764(-)
MEELLYQVLLSPLRLRNPKDKYQKMKELCSTILNPTDPESSLIHEIPNERRLEIQEQMTTFLSTFENDIEIEQSETELAVQKLLEEHMIEYLSNDIRDYFQPIYLLFKPTYLDNLAQTNNGPEVKEFNNIIEPNVLENKNIRRSSNDTFLRVEDEMQQPTKKNQLKKSQNNPTQKSKKRKRNEDTTPTTTTTADNQQDGSPPHKRSSSIVTRSKSKVTPALLRASGKTHTSTSDSMITDKPNEESEAGVDNVRTIPDIGMDVVDGENDNDIDLSKDGQTNTDDVNPPQDSEEWRIRKANEMRKRILSNSTNNQDESPTQSQSRRRTSKSSNDDANSSGSSSQPATQQTQPTQPTQKKKKSKSTKKKNVDTSDRQISQSLSSASMGFQSRKRVPWSPKETMNLIKGVNKFGNSWSEILRSYDFDPKRTSVDLKDKWRNLQKKKQNLTATLPVEPVKKKAEEDDEIEDDDRHPNKSPSHTDDEDEDHNGSNSGKKKKKKKKDEEDDDEDEDEDEDDQKAEHNSTEY